jgi:hypothetical protein
MKTSFRSFLTPPAEVIEAAWASDKSVFIFDTNVLLNLYGFEEQTRTDFFSAVAKLGGKVFLPFHVGLEYHLGRLAVIRNEKKTFRELTSISKNLEEKLEKDLGELKLSEKFPQVGKFANKLRENIKTALSTFAEDIDPWNKQQPDVRSDDKILDSIDAFSDGHIGPPPASQDWLNNLYKDGAERYANKVPPGFRDITKDKDHRSPTFVHNELTYERKYGDLIIWRQILEHVREEHLDNVFFVTDDAKEDWWTKINSGGEKIIGPHEALRSEIYKIPNVHLFHMYSTSDFLDNGRRILDVKINQRSIDDATNKTVTIRTTDNPMKSGLPSNFWDNIRRSVEASRTSIPSNNLIAARTLSGIMRAGDPINHVVDDSTYVDASMIFAAINAERNRLLSEGVAAGATPYGKTVAWLEAQRLAAEINLHQSKSAELQFDEMWRKAVSESALKTLGIRPDDLDPDSELADA